MKKFMATVLATGMITGITSLASAASFTFEGDIVYHNDIVELDFTLDNDATNVKVWTDSWMSGINFDPITALWKKSGNDWTLVAQNDDNGTIAPGQTRWDSGFSLNTLDAGEYKFTVATYANWANATVGGVLSDGFSYDNELPIVLANWPQPSNNVGMGTFWRVNLEGVDSAVNPNPVPEPATMTLLGLGLTGLAVRSRKRG